MINKLELQPYKYSLIEYNLNDNDLFRSLYITLTSLLEASNSWPVNIDSGRLINGVIFID